VRICHGHAHLAPKEDEQQTTRNGRWPIVVSSGREFPTWGREGAGVDDELVYGKAEELRDRDRFFAQDVADLMLESDVGAVLQSLHRLVDQGRLLHLDPLTDSGASEDAMEFEGFRFPLETGESTGP